MGLSNDIKVEIIKKNIHKKEMHSVLQGVFVSAGSLVISNGVSFVISSECEAVSIFVAERLGEMYPDIDFNISKVVRSFKNKEKFELSPSKNGEQILRDLGVIYDNNGQMKISDVCDKAYLKSEQTMKAFLTGMFLGSGGLSAPVDSKEKRGYGYHFEIDVLTKNQADMVAEIFSNFDIFPKSVVRGDEFVVYLKNSETICDALSLLGASKTVLDLMNKKVDRDMNNLTNRQVNCISANLDKTVNAALKQLQAIEVIQHTIGLESLPDNLCETALLRLGNPEASLSDLLSLMETKISKGALAQRFDKLIKLSKELGENDD